jgi:hypothetical protein
MAPVKLLSLTERISNKGDVVNAVELGLGDTGVKVRAGGEGGGGGEGSPRRLAGVRAGFPSLCHELVAC